MACLYDLLHASDFPGCKPDLDSTGVEGGFRENVSHHAASKLPSTLILFLRDVYSQSWLDVLAVLAVHDLASLAIRR
jgi:hypothetical protein